MGMSIKPIYYLVEAITGLRRNLLATIIAVTTVAVSLVVLGAFVVLTMIINKQILILERKVEITVHLKNSATSDQVLALENYIRALGNIKNVKYVSKDEALERLKKQFKDQPDILNQLQGNPLPASLEVRLDDPRLVGGVVTKLNNKYLEVIDDIRYGRDYVKKLFAVTKVIRGLGFVFVIVLWIASMVVIANTIRLAIFARRKEIGIMKLVGATNWFIRWPFLLEGVIQGMLGVALALALLWGFNKTVLQSLLKDITIFSSTVNIISVEQLTTILASAGITIGAIGSIIALRKYLQV